MKRDHYVKAFDLVLSEVEPHSTLSVDQQNVLRTMINDFGIPSSARDLLHRLLDARDWDWPMWIKFEKRTGRDTIAGLLSEISDASKIELLGRLTYGELKALAVARCAAQTLARSKTKLIEQIAQVDDDQMFQMIESFRGVVASRLTLKTRQEKCEALCGRIQTVAMHLYRKEQLEEMDKGGYATHWGFRWCGDLNMDAPKNCKKYDKTVLPSGDARKKFPTLPCDFLQCGCSVLFMTAATASDWSKMR